MANQWEKSSAEYRGQRRSAFRVVIEIRRSAEDDRSRTPLAVDYINEPKLSEQIQGILFFEHCKISARNRPKMQKQTHRGDLSPSRNAQDDRSLTLPVDFDQTKPNDRAFPDIRV